MLSLALVPWGRPTLTFGVVLQVVLYRLSIESVCTKPRAKNTIELQEVLLGCSRFFFLQFRL